MDIQTALRTMELSPSADLGDLREAFRRLAKQYHPDRVKYSPAIGAGDDRMKEINLAFNLLQKELKSPEPRESFDNEKTAPPEKPHKPFFSFVQNWKKQSSQQRGLSPSAKTVPHDPLRTGVCHERASLPLRP